MKFFINPDSELKIEIEKDENEKYKEIIESELYVRELKPFYDSFIKNFSVYKTDIENESNKEKKIKRGTIYSREGKRKN